MGIWDRLGAMMMMGTWEKEAEAGGGESHMGSRALLPVKRACWRIHGVDGVHVDAFSFHTLLYCVDTVARRCRAVIAFLLNLHDPPS
jgi:hypothetical protein